MSLPSDCKIIDSWLKNAAPWIGSIENNEIESRQLVTNQAIIDAVRSRKPETGIDIGCGEGWLIRALPEVRMTGIDVVPDLVAKARQTSLGEFKVMSYEDMAAGQLTTIADVAVCNFSLLGKESVEGLFKSILAFLKPGGSFIIQTLHPAIACGEQEYKDGWRAGNWCGFSDAYIDPPPWYFRTIESWINLYLAAGLRLCEIREPVHPKTGKPASIIFIGQAAG